MGMGKLQRLLADPAVPGLLRGEIWIDSQVLAKEGFPPGPRGLVGFAQAVGADICFFSWPDGVGGMDARELAALVHGQGLDCALVIDGPFQRLAARRDLCTLLGELARNAARFTSHLAQEKERLLVVLDGLEGAPIDLVLIGEDVGYSGGLYFAPEIFRTQLLPFYAEILRRFRVEGMAWGWHSDGNVEALLPDLVDCGFQCFSLEPEAVDLLTFKKRHGSRICLVGGIRADWLTAAAFDHGMEEAALREIGALIREGGLVLSSACGLHHPAFLPNLKRLYRLITPFSLKKTGAS